MDNPEVKQAQQAVMNAPHAPGLDATTPRNCRRNNNNFLQARNHEKTWRHRISGRARRRMDRASGRPVDAIPAHDAAPASTSAQGGDSGRPRRRRRRPTCCRRLHAAGQRVEIDRRKRYRADLRAEPERTVLRRDKGTPHGFNVEFARLLFADPSFPHGGKPVVVDTRHEVDTYPGVPKQLLDTDAKGNHVVDVAMDGLTFPDNTPSGIVIRCRTSTISAIR